MKFLFWNIQKKPLSNEIAELVVESGSDICAFSEISDETLQDAVHILSTENKLEYSAIKGLKGSD